MIDLGVISKVYDDRIDVRLDGGTALRNVMVASNIPRLLLQKDRRVCVLLQPKPLIVAVVSEEVLPDTVSIHFERTGSMKIDGVLDLLLPGVLKCKAANFKEGTGFWLDYNDGNPRLFVGNAYGQYISWDGTTMTINGNIKVLGTYNWATDYGPIPEAPNLLRNPDFGFYNKDFGIAEHWILSGQAVLLESI